ncbi:MAG: hypothetical protein WCW02_01050 [Candidatus Buchananbacteria bacterium]
MKKQEIKKPAKYPQFIQLLHFQSAVKLFIQFKLVDNFDSLKVISQELLEIIKPKPESVRLVVSLTRCSINRPQTSFFGFAILAAGKINSYEKDMISEVASYLAKDKELKITLKKFLKEDSSQESLSRAFNRIASFMITIRIMEMSVEQGIATCSIDPKNGRMICFNPQEV